MISAAAPRTKNQVDQIVTFTLVELLTSLVFIAMLLAVVLRTEALANLDPAQENVLRLRNELAEARQELGVARTRIAALERELEEQRSLVRRLMAEAGAPLPANDYIVVRRETYDANMNATDVVEEQQKQLADLQREIAALRGGASIVRPRCTTNSGYLLNVSLNADGTFTARPAWASVASSQVAQIDGLQAMIGGGRMSAGSFNAAARRMNDWARAQKIPCAFYVRAGSSHGNLNLYLRQLATVEQHFYVFRTR
jgi:cell division protein FtsL